MASELARTTHPYIVGMSGPTRSELKRERQERQAIVAANYQRIGHASEYSIHVWREVFPDGVTDAQIFGGVGAYEKKNPHLKRKVWHVTPPGFVSRKSRKFAAYCKVIDPD